MLGGKRSNIIVAAAAAGIGGFVAIWMLDFSIVRADWCTGVEVACTREWIGALSGWAAAIAAGITLFALYAQLSEQREQTSFMLGRALPTVVANHPEGHWEDLTLRVVNWNRYPLDLREVRVLGSTLPISVALTTVHIDGRAIDVEMDTAFSGIVRIAGWEDHSAPPPHAEIMAVVSFDGTRDADRVEVLHAKFAVDMLLFGERPRVITATAELSMRTDEL